MKHQDFKIGTLFQTCTGQRWRCTDVGQRTILAIELEPGLDEAWFVGPPYAIPEVVFSERDIERAYRDEIEAIKEAVAAADYSAHPGYPNEIVGEMMSAKRLEESRAYPHPDLFHIDRVDDVGEILHPFSAERNGSSWSIRLYRTFEQTFCVMPELEFIRLRSATEEDVRQRA